MVQSQSTTNCNVFASEQDDFTYSYDTHESEYAYADCEIEDCHDDAELEYIVDDYEPEYVPKRSIPDHTVIVKAGSPIALLNDTNTELDSPVLFYENTLLVSIADVFVLWETVDAEAILCEDELTEDAEIWVDDVAYVELDIVVDALGFYLHEITLDEAHFAVVTVTEISQWKARTLAMDAKAGLVVADSSDNDSDEDIFDAFSAMAMPLSDDAALRIARLRIGQTRAVIHTEYTRYIETIYAPLGQNGRMFIPVEDIAELLGASANFANDTLTVSRGNREIELVVGREYMRVWIGGVQQPNVDLDAVQPDGHPWGRLMLVGGVPFAPVNVMAGIGLGFHVYWIAADYEAVVSTREIDPLNFDGRHPCPFDPGYIVPQSIGLTPTAATLIIDNGLYPYVQLTATILPTNTTNQTVIWTSSNENVATVSAAGVVTAVGYGTAIITARTATNNFTATSTIRVHERATNLTFTPTNFTLYVEGTVGETQLLTPTITPTPAYYQNVRWTSDVPAIAEVDQNTGVVRAVNAGTTTIRATLAGVRVPQLSAQATVTVRRRPTDIILNRDTLTLHMTGDVGEIYTELTATVYPADAYNQQVDWTSNNTDIATVDANGNITAISTGDAIITARVRGTNISRTVLVRVLNLATGIELNYDVVHLLIYGDQFAERQLIETIIPADAVNTDVFWTSSDDNIVYVDQNGLISARNAGTAMITVGIHGTDLYAASRVYVDIFPTGITLNYTSRTLILNNPAERNFLLEALIESPSVSGDELVWTSDNPDVATVDSTGLVRSVGLGTTFIHATYSGLSATAFITVVNELRGITLPPVTTLVIDGYDFETKTLEVTFDPEYVSERRVLWETSNPNVVTVNMQGEITAERPGVAYVTATSADGGHTATTRVVVESRVTHVLVNERELLLHIDGDRIDTHQLSWRILPENASNQSVEFIGYDDEIIHVSTTGYVTAVDGGMTEIIIRAVDNGIVSDTRVTVIVRVVGLNIVPPSRNLTPANTAVTDTYRLEVVIDPEHATAQNVDWRSGDESIATVDANGLVRGVRPGRATITASLDGRSATIAVTVDPELILKLNFTGTFANGIVHEHDFYGNMLMGSAGMMPIRVLESLGGIFSWHGGIGHLNIDGFTMNFAPNRNTMYWSRVGVPGFNTVILPTAPVSISDRLYVPIRPLAAVLGYDLHWRATEVRGEQYVLLTRMDLTSAEVWDKINHARSPANWDIQRITGIRHDYGRTMIPARSILDRFADRYDWEQDTQTLRMVLDRRIFNFQLGRGTMVWAWEDSRDNFTVVPIDSRPFLAENYLQIPIHYVLAVLGWGSCETFVHDWGIASRTMPYFTLTHGASSTLTATVLPDVPNIESRWHEWESSHSNIVSVDSATGQITSRGIGAATITVRNGRAHLAADNQSDHSDSILVRVVLAQPTGLGESEVTHNTARLAWDAVSGAAHYRVERRQYGAGSWQHSGTVARTQTHHIAQNLTPNTRYQFRVIAQAGAARSSAWDSIASTPIAFYTRLAPPENLRTTEIWTTRTTLAWNAAPGAAYYWIERNAGSGWVHAATTAGTSIEITGLSGGVQHRFRVRAQLDWDANNPRNSLWSAELRVLTRPHAPGNLRMTANSLSSITIAWNASIGATSYVVYRNGNRVATGVTGTSFTASGLAANSSHTFRIRAANASGEGSQTAAQTFRTLAPTRAPSSPAVGTPSDMVVHSWPAPTHNHRDNVSSPFGWRAGDFNRYHWGVDVNTPTGQRINAIMDGVVEEARIMWGGGRTIIIRHSNGYRSVYMHLSRIDVSVGDPVRRGQQIALSGSTDTDQQGRLRSNVLAPHLHFEVRRGSANTTAFNTIPWYHRDDCRTVNPNPMFILNSHNRWMPNPNFLWSVVPTEGLTTQPPTPPADGDGGVTSVAIRRPLPMVLSVGHVRDLGVYVLPFSAPNRAVNWSSNRTGVATVNASGQIRAVSVGRATITVTSAANSALQDSFELEVVPAVIPSRFSAQVAHFYDDGFRVHHGITDAQARTRINNYQNVANRIFQESLGIAITSPNQPASWRSPADIWKGTVTAANIDTMDTGTYPTQTDRTPLRNAFGAAHPGTLTRTSAFWSGNRIRSFSGGNESINRSFASPNHRAIFQMGRWRIASEASGVLVHELAHMFGAPDHYHEWITRDGREVCIGGHMCAYEEHGNPNPRPTWCNMGGSSRRADIATVHGIEVFCVGCRDDMLRHLNKHNVGKGR